MNPFILLKRAVPVVAIFASVACKPYQSTIHVQGTFDNCGGRELEPNPVQEKVFAKEDFVYRKENSKKGFAKVKADENGYLVITHRAKYLEFFMAEKLSTAIEEPSEKCDNWRKKPDFTIKGSKKSTQHEVFFQQECNPCVLPMP